MSFRLQQRNSWTGKWRRMYIVLRKTVDIVDGSATHVGSLAGPSTVTSNTTVNYVTVIYGHNVANLLVLFSGMHWRMVC